MTARRRRKLCARPRPRHPPGPKLACGARIPSALDPSVYRRAISLPSGLNLLSSIVPTLPGWPGRASGQESSARCAALCGRSLTRPRHRYPSLAAVFASVGAAHAAARAARADPSPTFPQAAERAQPGLTRPRPRHQCGQSARNGSSKPAAPPHAVPPHTAPPLAAPHTAHAPAQSRKQPAGPSAHGAMGGGRAAAGLVFAAGDAARRHWA
jgi:hypothetical protein